MAECAGADLPEASEPFSTQLPMELIAGLDIFKVPPTVSKHRRCLYVTTEAAVSADI